MDGIIDKIYEALSSYKYVSFDLFDTLIFRLVNCPTDIFEIVEAKYQKQKGQKNKFKKKRIRAECEARRDLTMNSAREDITLDDIYKYIRIEDKEYLKELEKSTEIEYSYPNRQMIHLLRNCKKDNKTIIITTDMYLDREVIEKILRKNTIDYDYLYISGECGRTKYRGGLYSYVLNSLHLKESDLVHVGNDSLTDVKRADEKGIRSIHYDEERKIPVYIQGLLSSKKNFMRVCANLMFREIQFAAPPERLGFCVLGPFITEFCNWLHVYKREHKIDTLWFIAREGYFIKQTYDLMYPDEHSEYISLNKNILRYPYLYYYPSYEAFKDTIPSGQKLTLFKLFEYFYISDSEQKEICIEFNLTLQTIADSIDRIILNKIFTRILFLCKNQITNQHDYLHEYLLKKTGNSRRIGLVNNSVNGNGQYLLSKLVPRYAWNYEFIGLQFIQSLNCSKRNLEVYSWLDGSYFSKRELTLFCNSMMVLEHLLFENKGTSLRLDNNGNEIEVVSAPLLEESANRQIVNSVQDASLRYSKSNACRIMGQGRLFSKIFFDFLENPSLEDAEMIGQLWDVDIGGSKMLVPKINRDDMGKIFTNIKNSRNYDLTKWPAGYLVLSGTPGFARKIYNAMLYLKKGFSL